MLTWISQNDTFYQLLGVSDEDIETPLAIHDMLITYYKKTPLYKGLSKNELMATNINHFKSLIDPDIKMDSSLSVLNSINNIIDIKQFTLTTNLSNNDELNNLTLFIKIILYKHFNYDINDVVIQYTDTSIILIPTVNVNQNIDYLYCTIDDFNKMTSFINLDQCIGYKPLLSLTHDPITIELLASDLVWTLDLSSFDYLNLYNIPVVSIKGRDIDHAKATYIEFTLDTISPLVSSIASLLPNTFIIQLNKNIVNLLISQYNFKILPISLPDVVCLQHECLNQQWVMNNMTRLEQNGPSLYPFTVYFEPYLTTKELVKAMAKIYYMATIIYKRYDTQYVNDIVVDSTLTAFIPIFHVSMIDQINHDLNCWDKNLNVQLFYDQPKTTKGEIFKIKEIWAVVI
jgi:hypothetical protein